MSEFRLRASLGDSFQQEEEQGGKEQEQQEAGSRAKGKTYDVYWYQEDQHFMKPQMRENASFSQYRNQIILWGGQGMRVFKSFWLLDARKGRGC